MKVQFLRDTAQARVGSCPPGTIVLYREGFGYGIPQIPGAEYIEFLEYRNRYTLFSPPMIVVVGLNRIITPANRCDMVNEYLQTMTPNVPKICVDTAPFIGEPWRLWFHYSIANCGRFAITYSYAIETEWEHWFYRDVPDCRLSAGNIRLFLSDTIADLDLIGTRFEMVDIAESEERWYEQAKAHMFEKYDTPKLLVNNLLKLANRHFDLDISFNSWTENRVVRLPDVGVYRFVGEECRRRLDIHNEVVNYGRENLPE